MIILWSRSVYLFDISEIQRIHIRLVDSCIIGCHSFTILSLCLQSYGCYVFICSWSTSYINLNLQNTILELNKFRLCSEIIRSFSARFDKVAISLKCKYQVLQLLFRSIGRIHVIVSVCLRIDNLCSTFCPFLILRVLSCTSTQCLVLERRDADGRNAINVSTRVTILHEYDTTEITAQRDSILTISTIRLEYVTQFQVFLAHNCCDSIIRSCLPHNAGLGFCIAINLVEIAIFLWQVVSTVLTSSTRCTRCTRCTRVTLITLVALVTLSIQACAYIINVPNSVNDFNN